MGFRLMALGRRYTGLAIETDVAIGYWDVEIGGAAWLDEAAQMGSCPGMWRLNWLGLGGGQAIAKDSSR